MDRQQLALPGLEHDGMCGKPYPLFPRSLCIKEFDHDDRHGAIVPGMGTMLREWNDGDSSVKLALVRQLPPPPIRSNSGRRATPQFSRRRAS